MRTPFQQFCDKAVIGTDKDLKRYIREVQGLYGGMYDDIAARVREFFMAYRESGSKEGIYKWAMNTGEYTELMSDLEFLYTERADAIEDRIYAVLIAVVTGMYYKMTYADAWLDGMPTDIDLPPSLAELLVEGSDSAWTSYADDPTADRFGDPSLWMPKHDQLSSILRANRSKRWSDIKAHLTSSLSIGAGLRTTLKTVRRDINMVTRTMRPDGTTVTKVHGASAEATRVLRTEGNRLINAAVIAAAVGMYGVGTPKAKKEWVAILDSKTREQSYEMDGQIVGLDEPFIYPNGATSMYPGQSGFAMYDVNCRCSCMTVLVSDEGQTVGVDPFSGEEGRFSWGGYDDWYDAMVL